jgi:hypothetical protein
MKYQHSARAIIVPVVCASENTPLTLFFEDQHAWLLCPRIGNIRNDIHRTAKKPTLILFQLIAYALKGAKNTNDI